MVAHRSVLVMASESFHKRLSEWICIHIGVNESEGSGGQDVGLFVNIASGVCNGCLVNISVAMFREHSDLPQMKERRQCLSLAFHLPM